MLVENMENWKESLIQQSLQKGVQKGIQKGKLEGKRESARSLILVKFGEKGLAQCEVRLAQASEAVLDRINHAIFSAESVEELF